MQFSSLLLWYKYIPARNLKFSDLLNNDRDNEKEQDFDFNGAMATATGQRFSNGSLNGVAHHQLHGHANGKYPSDAAHHHIMHGLVGGDDDTGGATEQFPPFDPLHDGSEEDAIVNGNASDDDDDDEEYTHSSITSAVSSEVGQQRRGNEEPSADTRHHDHDDGEVGKENHEEEQSHTPMSNVDPVPEADLHRYQQQQASPSQHRDDDASATSQATTTTVLSPVTSPPYWALAHTDSLNSRPSASSHPFNNHDNTSTESLVPGAITLQDNEADDDDDERGNLNGHHNHNGEPQRQRTSEETRTSYGRDRNKACWAKSVEVTNYVIVNGSATNIGAFVVWNIRVQTLSVGFILSFGSIKGKKKRRRLAGCKGVVLLTRECVNRAPT